jgi:gliding motility-associated-like protein
MTVIAFIDSAEITSWNHDLSGTGKTMAACYAVTAIDSFYNESPVLKRICVDECFEYSLPNVFTPNGDNINDILHPLPYWSVEKIDLKIFNRWGNLVYQTEDPDINWDGTYLNEKKRVSDGVYYYICDVYTQRLSGLEHTTIIGYIHVYTEGKEIKFSE